MTDMELHVPVEAGLRSLASVVGYITEGLDAVVVHHEVSPHYEGHQTLRLAGNPRDLEIARERAKKVGAK